MDSHARLPIELLSPYLRSDHYEDERYSVKIDLFSDPVRLAFEISMKVKEPDCRGAYPQRRYSLERHSQRGHEGVHVQIDYHLVDNAMDMGKLYIFLDVSDDMELIDTAQGFLYTLYQILSDLDTHGRFVPELINLKHIEDLSHKKDFFVRKLYESFKDRGITVRNLIKDETVVYTGKQIIELMKDRKELMPLLGPIIDLEEVERPV